MPDYAPGTPSWVDLGSPDVDASIRFYGDLFGWSASEEGPPEAGGYRFFLQDGKMVGGLGPLMMEGQPPAWLNYVTVADADGTVANAREAGGAIHVEPMDVMDVGRMSIGGQPDGRRDRALAAARGTPGPRSSTSRSHCRGTSSTRATRTPRSRSTRRSSAGRATRRRWATSSTRPGSWTASRSPA